jgi:membrane-associated phospholipid phosphatase
VKETITTTILVIVAGVVPAVVIFLVSLIFVPGKAVSSSTPKKLIWRRKLWEWNTGWMGLALSLALAALFTQGIKNLVGKPRPCLLARCDPDLSAIANSEVDSFAATFNLEWVLVNYTICRQTDKSFLDDGFKSFPSGHASSMSTALHLYDA